MTEAAAYTPLAQRPDESEFEYHKRLIYGKLVDKTLSDYDYSELSKFAYGKEYSADVARRLFYGSHKTLELLEREKFKNVDSSDILSGIEAKKIELQKERQRFLDQRREHNKIISAEGRLEHLYDTLEVCAGRLNETVGALYSAPQKSNAELSDDEAVLVLTDWHYGLKTKNIFNEYDTEICKGRVHRVITAAAERISLHKCRRLHILVLGDLFHGAIHVGARVASEELVCDQLMQVSEILAQSIDYLSQYVEYVNVYMTYGNHARTVQNKNESIHRDNMERVVPWWLKTRLSQNGKVTVADDNGTEFIYASPCGHGICAVHGDNDTVTASSKIIPALFQKQYGKDIEYIILGDKHHRESYESLGTEAVMCGSLCGTDDYANSKRLYSVPSQLLLIVNPEVGVDAEYRIKCV